MSDMRILAIDTATAASSVALGVGREIKAIATRVDTRGHVSFLVPALDFCFRQAGWDRADIDAVVVDVGPGLFTGIRAGLATAQGIAAAAGVPIVPVNALDVIALRATTGRRQIWPIVDARRGQIATAPYRPVPGGVVREGPIELMRPDEFQAQLGATEAEALVVGDYQALGEGVLSSTRHVKFGRPRFPTADLGMEMAVRMLDSGDVPLAEDVRPLYLREADVAINWTDFRGERPA